MLKGVMQSDNNGNKNTSDGNTQNPISNLWVKAKKAGPGEQPIMVPVECYSMAILVE
jgi:hypothetical protein